MRREGSYTPLSAPVAGACPWPLGIFTCEYHHHLWLDAGYSGEDKGGGDWVKKTLGWTVEIVRRPRKPAPEEVLMAWAQQWAKEGVRVDWQKLLPPKGFQVL